MVNKILQTLFFVSITSLIRCAPLEEQESSKITGRLANLLPTNPVDPGIPGTNQATEPAEYTPPNVTLLNVARPVEMRAVVVGPKSAPGLRPLVIFLHGRASNCYTPNPNDPTDHTQGTSSGEWPCPTSKLLFSSFRGYVKTQTLFATHGFVTVSISSNGVNAQDIKGTNTALFQKVATRSTHSSTCVGDDPIITTTPNWQIRGLLFIAPQTIGQNPVPNIPSVVILSGCDGDLTDLEGQMYIDGLRGVDKGLALHSSPFVANASHLYFNSEWPQISTHTPTCDPTNPQNGLLTRAQQEAALAGYAIAAAHLFLESNDHVRPLIDGSGFRAASVSSAGPVTVLSHAIGANRIPFIEASELLKVTGEGAMSSQTVTIRRPYPTSIVGSESIAMRATVRETTIGTKVAVSIIDASGHRATFGTFSLDGLPSTAPAGAPNWAQEVRLPLTGATAAGIDLNQVYALEIIP
ncbi:hypothetical protein B0J14DRAFT_659851 [Halenospora varia]|nr:hypothetical protein B0J14DRAFT_659851 [Halenospora varia]